MAEVRFVRKLGLPSVSCGCTSSTRARRSRVRVLTSSFRNIFSQVVGDGAGTDEQRRRDLPVRVAVARQPRDLRLLRCQLVASLDFSLARVLAAGKQLDAGSLGEHADPRRVEHLLRHPELDARVAPATPVGVAIPSIGVVRGRTREPSANAEGGRWLRCRGARRPCHPRASGRAAPARARCHSRAPGRTVARPPPRPDRVLRSVRPPR